MKKVYLLLVLATFAVLFFTAVSATSRDDKPAPEMVTFTPKNLGSFEGIAASSSVDVVVAPGADRVSVTMPAELRDYLSLEVRGNRLCAGFKTVPEKLRRTLRYSYRTVVSVPVKAYRELHATSSADISLPVDFRSGNVKVSVTSSADIKGGMNCDVLTINASSSGDVALRGQCRQVLVNATSSADVELDMISETVTVAATSSADVELAGKCNVLKINATSSADVNGTRLEAAEAECVASSSADISVFATRKLNMSASSSAKIVYRGNAEIRQSATSGANIIRAK